MVILTNLEKIRTLSIKIEIVFMFFSIILKLLKGKRMKNFVLIYKFDKNVFFILKWRL